MPSSTRSPMASPSPAAAIAHAENPYATYPPFIKQEPVSPSPVAATTAPAENPYATYPPFIKQEPVSPRLLGLTPIIQSPKGNMYANSTTIVLEIFENTSSRVASPVIKRESESPAPFSTASDLISASTELQNLTRDAPVMTSSADGHNRAQHHTPQRDPSKGSNKENNSPSSSERSPRLKLILKRPSDKAAPSTPNVDSDNSQPGSSSTNSSSSGLKSKLRGIQAALREPLPDIPRPSLSSTNRKRALSEASNHEEDDTDSEIELFPSKSLKKPTKTANDRMPKAMPKAKRAKLTQATESDDDDAMFDASHDEDSHEETAQKQLSLFTPIMKRNRRILDPSNPAHAKLIASASKTGNDYYESDADDEPGAVKDTSKPHLFRNVKWGSCATDYSNDADFVKEPEFTQFVPGRFELMPDGTVSDQKAKLVVKIIDKAGRKRIFANPPPRDWQNQEAITALNKRTVQQIRRNTNVRFREVVRAYVTEERKWILANLTAGKPTHGWKVFVDQFNKRFEGKTVQGTKGARPYRSHSSLTKEVERFGAEFYSKGLVPVPSKKAKKE